MRKGWIAAVAVTAAFLIAPWTVAAERGGKGHAGKEHAGKGHARKERAVKAEKKAPPQGFKKGKKKGWKGEDHPPGWSEGKKKGWEGESTPPGKTP